MIVTIEKSENLKDRKFNGSVIDISRFKTVTLEHLYIEFSLKVSNCMIDLSSSLIDKTPGNPHQIIGSTFLANSSKYLWFQPSPLRPFKIQCHSLEESLFEILLPEKYKQREISEIRITLKFDE